MTALGPYSSIIACILDAVKSSASSQLTCPHPRPWCGINRVQYARSQDLGVVDEVVAAHALKAQLALVGDAVERFGTHDLAVLDQEG